MKNAIETYISLATQGEKARYYRACEGEMSQFALRDLISRPEIDMNNHQQILEVYCQSYYDTVGEQFCVEMPERKTENMRNAIEDYRRLETEAEKHNYYNACENLMDLDLLGCCEDLSQEEYLAKYCEAHFEKYGEEFCVN